MDDIGGPDLDEHHPEDGAESVAAAFLRTAADHPDREALAGPAGSWTYHELAEQVRRDAAGIIDRVDSDGTVPIGLLAAHDAPLVSAVLSILAAGQIVVILDPAAPASQTADVVAECRPALLLHDADHADAAAAVRRTQLFDLPVVALSTLGRDPGPLPPRGLDDPAMLAFTSGTSGRPKGAIITHGVLMSVAWGATDALAITYRDRMPMLFPPSLAVAAYPMLLPLVNGGALVTLDVRTVGLAPIADFLRDNRITLAYMAPTVMRFLAEPLEGLDFPDLRMIALGGELVDADAVAITHRCTGARSIAIGYGTTETGVVALNVIDPSGPVVEPVAVGRPLAGIEVTLVDDAGDAVAGPGPGEVVIGGRYLFHGYWNHPELNRQMLSPDPEGRPGWHRFRTGDFGCFDESGALVITGRLDSKVKIRGRFVVLGDVETVVRDLDGVADASVICRTRGGVDELVAYVVPSADTPPTATSLRSALLADHEAYRVPSVWVFLDELPRLPNGKTDRRALPSPDAVIGSPASAGVAAGADGAHDHHELRERLRQIWEDLLPAGSIGLDERFPDLGGDSLLAAQMLIAVERETGVTVPMGELVHAQTVRELAEVVGRVSERAGDRRESTAVCVQPGDPSRPVLWFFPDLQGSAYRVRHAAAALGADQPVWSFESPLLSGRPPQSSRLNYFVVPFIDDLRRVQPEGPYWLCGYSFGGICAYEVARQLRADGDDVAFLGVIDVGPGYRGPGWHARRSPLRPWFGIAPPAPSGMPPLSRLRYYRDMVVRNPLGALRHAEVRAGLHRIVDPIRFRADLRRHGRVRAEWRLWYAWEQHWRMAAKAWDRASVSPVHLDLFWAEDSASADATMGWGPLVDAVDVHRFAGDHEAILEPRGAPALSAALRTVIDARLDSGRSPALAPDRSG